MNRRVLFKVSNFFLLFLICINFSQAQVKKKSQPKPKVSKQAPATITKCSRTTDSIELIKVYNSLGGPGWFNSWKLNEPISKWYGVTLSKTGCVSEVVMSNNNLIGFIPPISMSNLVQLMLDDKKISGKLPQLANLPNLCLLYTSRCV